MTEHRDTDMSERLEPLIGQWNMQAVFPSSSPIDSPEAHGAARTVFEWLPGRQFLVQRWEVAHPAAPDGIAIIGFDASRGCYLQHYFDSRGVARLYEMSFAAGMEAVADQAGLLTARFLATLHRVLQRRRPHDQTQLGVL